MSDKKDDIVNKAIAFTRPYRPIEFDEKTGDPMGPWTWLDLIDDTSGEKDALLALCLSIQKYLYGEEDNGK